eukprot:COSAG06_NODE_8655_length_2105_cov_4.570788_2_plen_208_part_00
MDLRGTGVYGLVSSLSTLSHVGQCWEPFNSWSSGGGACAPLYDGGLFLTGSLVHGPVGKLQALPGLGPTWRPDAERALNITDDYWFSGSYSSCAAFNGCATLPKVADAPLVAGVDVAACCVSPNPCALQSGDIAGHLAGLKTACCGAGDCAVAPAECSAACAAAMAPLSGPCPAASIAALGVDASRQFYSLNELCAAQSILPLAEKV